MSQPKRQLVIFAALSASYLLGMIVSAFFVRTGHAPAVEVPVHSVSSTVESTLPTIPEP